MSKQSVKKYLDVGEPNADGMAIFICNGFTLIIDVSVRESTLVPLDEVISMAKNHGILLTENMIEGLVNGV